MSLLASCLALVFCAETSFALPPLATTKVECGTDLFATFESHNQKLVSNRYGVFMTYVSSADQSHEDHRHATWKLAQSTDGGGTFSSVYTSSPINTRPPIIETDDSGRIYVIYSEYSTDEQPPPSTAGRSTLLVFSPPNFTEPSTTVINPNPQVEWAGTGKMAMFLDAARGKLYYFAGDTNHFYTISNLNGTPVVSPVRVPTKAGDHAQVHYPLLSVDQTTGQLYAAWTTSPREPTAKASNCPVSNPDCLVAYHDIHFMRLKQDGIQWERANGAPLTLPVESDETGPTDGIVLSDEYDTDPWLSSFLVKQGKIHFLYHRWGAPERQHYVRYDIATGAIDRQVFPPTANYPEFRGESRHIFSRDGYFVTSHRADKTLYAVATYQGNRTDNKAPDPGSPPAPPGDSVVVLVSFDNGDSWHDFATGPTVTGNIYAIGGAREVSADGWIYGAYTLQVQENGTTVNKVESFRVYAGNPAARGTDFDHDSKSDLACHVGSTAQTSVATSDGPISFSLGATWPLGGGSWCSSGQQFLTGDFNGDGFDDLGCHDWGAGGNTYVAINTGSGGFTGGIWYKDGEPWCPSGYQLGVGDFNGDGRADLYCHSWAGGGNTYIATSNGSNGFIGGAIWYKEGQPWCPSGYQLGTGDFNGDGKTDLYCHSWAGGGNTYVATSNGSNGFIGGAIWYKEGQPWCPSGYTLGVGDFNADGKSDLYCHDWSGGGHTYVAISNGVGGFTGGAIWSKEGQAWCGLGNQLSVGDFDGDGAADLLCRVASAGANYIALSNRSGGFTGGGVWQTNGQNWCVSGDLAASW